MTIANELFRQLDAAIEESFDVETSTLPASFQGKRKRRSLSSIANQVRKKDKTFGRDPRSVSVKFDKKGNVTKATKSRLQTLEAYAKMVAEEKAIEFDVNEDALYSKELIFAGMLVKAGIIDPEDFE